MIPNVWVTNSIYNNEKRSHRKDQIATYMVKETFLSGVCVCVCVCEKESMSVCKRER